MNETALLMSSQNRSIFLKFDVTFKMGRVPDFVKLKFKFIDLCKGRDFECSANVFNT